MSCYCAYNDIILLEGRLWLTKSVYHKSKGNTNIKLKSINNKHKIVKNTQSKERQKKETEWIEKFYKANKMMNINPTISIIYNYSQGVQKPLSVIE